MLNVKPSGGKGVLGADVEVVVAAACDVAAFEYEATTNRKINVNLNMILNSKGRLIILSAHAYTYTTCHIIFSMCCGVTGETVVDSFAGLAVTFGKT